MSIKALILDFDGVFTDNKVICDSEGREAVVCSRADSLGIGMVNEIGIKLYVISSETNPVVASRCMKMGINYRKGVKNKLDVLKSWLEVNEVDPHEAIFVGNDVNDLQAMEFVGFSIAVTGSHPDVLQIADRVTGATGGNGAVREVCDLILNGEIEDELNSDNSG